MMKKYRDRNGEIIIKDDGQEKFLNLLYGSAFGRTALKFLTAPALSKIAGKFCDSPASQFMIVPFIKSAGINLSEYEPTSYRSYNDFFTRKIKPESRKIDMNPDHFISPCDSKLSVYKINEHSVFRIKNSFYSVKSLLKCRKIAEKYSDGYCMVFRLEVDDYHRYIYIDNGKKSANKHINGIYHTVNPIALESTNIYKENTREISVLHTENFDDVIQVEVGAMMVGRIVNRHGKTNIQRGDEKGLFEFGGSTIVLLVKKDVVKLDLDIIKNTNEGFETIVKAGEKIGNKYKNEDSIL